MVKFNTIFRYTPSIASRNPLQVAATSMPLRKIENKNKNPYQTYIGILSVID